MNIWTEKPTRRMGSKSPARAASIPRTALGLVLLAAAGCASRSQNPPALAPQTVSRVASPEAAPPGDPAPPTSAPERPASAIEKTIVIDPGGDSDSTTTLVAAAEAERERRSQSQGPTVVITDDNLKSQAVGLLTVATPAPRAGEGEDAEAAAAPPAADSPAAERYWRDRVLEERRDWRDLVDEVADLEEEVSLLRRRFYDEDDPYYRDSQIKPAWDRALDRLGLTRRLADEAGQRVTRTLEDGRRAGALPGWLREGLELEPTPGNAGETRPPRLREYEPGEPQIYDPDDDGSGRR